MKEHGMIFTGDMVLAMLDDRKTMTRRLITRTNTRVGKKRQMVDKIFWNSLDFDSAEIWQDVIRQFPFLKVEYPTSRITTLDLCPIYQVGDIIWVRETWGYLDNQEKHILFRADEMEFVPVYGKWKSPIHLKKKDARIWLKITDVRIQRVQEISVDDIIAEGMIIDFTIPPGHRSDLHGQFANLWDSINAKRGYPWENNDWVIALTYERIEK